MEKRHLPGERFERSRGGFRKKSRRKFHIESLCCTGCLMEGKFGV